MDVHRIIMHLDMDAFYASVEVRGDPRLAGLPVVVGALPQSGRGVVCTASYEARAYGIRSAMPIMQAYRRAPHAMFLAPDFARYKKASQAVMEVLEHYADVLEVVGLDEAYLDVTQACHDSHLAPWEQARALAFSLQAAVRRATGLSCSIGVAATRAVAKVASDLHKPHGLTVVRPQDEAITLMPLGVSRLHGCGPKATALLHEAGIHTIGDLIQAGPARLSTVLGSQGAWLYTVATGQDPRPVDGGSWERKSRGNESTFMDDVLDAATVQARASGLLEEILQDQASSGQLFSCVTVKIRYADFRTLTRSMTFPGPLDANMEAGRQSAADAARHLLEPLLGPTRVRLVGVRLSNFHAPTGQRLLQHFGFDARRLAISSPRPPRRRPASSGLRWIRLGQSP